MNRRELLEQASGLCVSGVISGPLAPKIIESARESTMVWHDVREWGVEGKGWKETVDFF